MSRLTMKLSDLFDVRHGSKLDLNKMRRLPLAEGGVNFVGRSSEKQGVSATIAPIPDIAPFPKGTITVALGGAKILSSFVQDRPFYTAQNVAVLTPLRTMSFAEKVFLCLCIRHNRPRYSAFGREANRTIRDIVVPDSFPPWIGNVGSQLGNVAAPLAAPPLKLKIESWKPFTLGKLFEIKKGRRIIRREWTPGSTPFVGTSTRRNGVVGYVGATPMFEGGCVTVPYNGQGGVGWACYQPEPFCASDDVQVLLAPDGADQAAMMFVSVVLRRERYRFSFGRKWHLDRMRETTIRLPSRDGLQPDWEAMSAFMKGLPFATGALG
jgi:hypothetical protein